MKLTKLAKAMLDTNPDDFLDTYGVNFVSEVFQGGSFLADHTVYMTVAKSETKFDPFKTYKIPTDVWSRRNVSDYFEALVSINHDVFKRSSNVVTRGGPKVNITSREPYDIGQQFQIWQKELSEDESLTTDIKMAWRKWYDIDEVKQIIDKKGNKTLTDLFSAAPPSTDIMRKISAEYATIQVVLEQMRQYREFFICFRAVGNKTFRQLLSDLLAKLTAKVHEMHNLTETQIKAIEE